MNVRKQTKVLQQNWAVKWYKILQMHHNLGCPFMWIFISAHCAQRAP